MHIAIIYLNKIGIKECKKESAESQIVEMQIKENFEKQIEDSFSVHDNDF